MKSFFVLLFAILTISCASTQEIQPERVYLDEEGKSISEIDFMQKWRSKENELARWDHIENGIRNLSLSSPLYSRYSLNYLPLLRNLERISGQQFEENSILIIGYVFKDDLCSSRSSNTWNKNRIRERKSFLKPIRKSIFNEYENVVYIYLFEEGLTLKNKPNSPDEYFFQDNNNFFRNLIFKDPTLCGSYALIKPNGQALVRNGEYRPDWLVSLLHPEYWNSIFP